jgi:hypothetical protein
MPDQSVLDDFQIGPYASFFISISNAALPSFETEVTLPFLSVMEATLTTFVDVVDATQLRDLKRNGTVRSLQGKIAFQATAGCPTNGTA